MKNPGGVDKKPRWLEKTHAKFEVSKWGYANQSCVFRNIKDIGFVSIYVLHFFWQDYWVMRRYKSKLVSPEGPTLVWAAGKIFESRLSTLLQMTFTKCFLRKKTFDFRWHLYVSLLDITTFFQKAVCLWLLSLFHWFWLLINRVLS